MVPVMVSCSVVLLLCTLLVRCSAGDTSRQPNVDNISPIDTKAPVSISRPGVLCVCVVCVIYIIDSSG